MLKSFFFKSFELSRVANLKIGAMMEILRSCISSLVNHFTRPALLSPFFVPSWPRNVSLELLLVVVLGPNLSYSWFGVLSHTHSLGTISLTDLDMFHVFPLLWNQYLSNTFCLWMANTHFCDILPGADCNWTPACCGPSSNTSLCRSYSHTAMWHSTFSWSYSPTFSWHCPFKCAGSGWRTRTTCW